MRTTSRWWITAVLLTGFSATGICSGSPTDAPAPAPSAAAAAAPDEALIKDQVCTRCHDESETKPILSIYQTRHGVRGDARTPTCQSCHGESEKHVRGDHRTRAAPRRMWFSRRGPTRPATRRCAQASAWPATAARTRTHWDGGQHQASGVACNDCHTIHAPADPVLVKGTQQEKCFACHKEQRADTPQDLHAPDRCRQDGLCRLPQPARRGRAETAEEEHRQRDLLAVPRREARPVPVGAPAGGRGLHELPHAARLEHHAAAQVAAAVPVSGMPRWSAQFQESRWPQWGRIPGGVVREKRRRHGTAFPEYASGRTWVHELPCHGSWIERPCRCFPAPLS